MSTNVQSGKVSRRLMILVAAAAVALTATACGNGTSGGTSGGTAPTATSAGTSAAAPADAVTAHTSALGMILVDGKGMTVYHFANDTGTTSTCTASCASFWPAVPAPDPLPAALPGVTGALGSTTRSDGPKQLTVAGHPVYTFRGDSAPGQTNGQGMVLNGGLWTVVSPAGVPLTKAAPAATTPAAGPTY
jgi:predicted lipoprotein with Yx(FWY)xxD motif